MIYRTRGSLLGSTYKLRYAFSLSYDSPKRFDTLLRNLSTAAERLGFRNSSHENPTGNSSNHIGYMNGDQCLGGFQQNSHGQSLNPEYRPVSGQNPNRFYQNPSNVYNQELSGSYGESSDGCSSHGNGNGNGNGIPHGNGNGNGIPQENAGFVHSQTSWNAPIQSWDSQNGAQWQTWASPNANDLRLQSHNQVNEHFQQDHNGHDSLEELDAVCREGKVKIAVDIIKSWRNEGYVVDLPRLLWLAQLCGDAQALQEAKVVHEFISSLVSVLDISAYNSIIEMYSGCESVEDALTVFNSVREKNSETWCTMIRCFAENGQGEDAIDMFSRFKEEGNRPDGKIFKEIFFACSVLGDINEGILHFESMNRDYGIIPSMEHYLSIVKMLAEPGYLDEAVGFVESMEPNVDLWETLMNLSRVHGDLELGDRCQDMVEQLDASRLNKESKAGLVPVKSSDIAKEKLQKMARGGKFKVGCMAAGDISLPENREYYMALKSLKEHMVEIGYVPESRLALHDVDQESKVENLFNHNERFAFVSSFLDTPARSAIRVLKNLRVCVDCHNALKLMSKIVGRELISRDAKRFHHMKDGVCSCGEYW